MIGYRAVDGCCVAVLLNNFGGSRHRNFEGAMDTADGMKNQLKKIGMYAHHNGGFELKKLATVTAYLTTEQTTANEVLESIGFEKTGTYKKAKHPDSDLNVWQIAAPKFQEWAEGYQPVVQQGAGGRFGNRPEVAAPAARQAATPVVWDEDFEEEDM